MKIGNQNAYPVTIEDNGNPSVTHLGLTKREYFAAMAMQGYIVQRRAQDDTSRRKVAEWSVNMADELLKALESKSE